MKALANDIGWDLDPLTILPQNMQNLMDSVVKNQDEPFPGLPTFGLQILAEFARKNGVRVVVGGQGGDEIGGGYEYYMGAFFLDTMLHSGPNACLDELNSYGKLHSFNNRERHLDFLIGTINAYVEGGTSADGTSFTKPEVLSLDFLKKAEKPRPIFQTPFSSHLQNMQYRDIFYTKLPRGLHSADRAAMAHGIEQRVPLLDYRLVELGLWAPNNQKIRNGIQRFFIRKAAKKILLPYVRKAPKRAVPSPQRNWFKKELRPWILSILSSKSFREHNYLNQNKVLEEYERYCRTPGIPKNSFHIWQWLHLEYWLRAYFD